MRVVSAALRKIRSAASWSAFELSLVLPVFCLLGLARLAILTVPFRTYARFLGQQGGLDAPDIPLTEAQLARARRIGHVVRRTAANTPWASLCLAQAMVASLLLRVFGIPNCVFFGLVPGEVINSPDPLAAHAWVRTDGYNVTGGQNVSAYTVVKTFVRHP